MMARSGTSSPRCRESGISVVVIRCGPSVKETVNRGAFGEERAAVLVVVMIGGCECGASGARARARGLARGVRCLRDEVEKREPCKSRRGGGRGRYASRARRVRKFMPLKILEVVFWRCARFFRAAIGAGALCP